MSNDKVTILKLINKKKEILFGKFSNTLTHDIKTKQWMDIAEKSKAIGIFGKDWKYFRDTTWQNWRKRTIEKRDRRMKTGSGGGKKFIYDDSDKVIFEIIGKDSPTLDVLSIPESCGKDSPEATNTIITEFECGVEDQVSTVDENVCNVSVSSGCCVTGTVNKNTSSSNFSNRKKMKRTVKFVDDDLLKLKKNKIREQTMLFEEKKEIAQRKKYKLDLELYKLENELGLPPSEFTERLYGVTYEDVTQYAVEVMEDSTGILQDLDESQILKRSLDNNDSSNAE